MIWFHKILELVFQTQLSSPRNICTEHWRKLPNLGRTCVKNFFNCAVHLFLRQNKVFTLHPLDLAVEFLFWFSFANLLSKIKSLFFSLWTKICQILHVIFESTRQFSFKFCINIQCHEATPLYFFRTKIICFYQKEPIKVQIFEVFECLGQNSSNSSCQFGTDKPIPLQFLHHSWLSCQITLLNLKVIHFQFWTNESYQRPNFEIFRCSGENLPNSSGHFWKHKSVFLQIFYQS